MNDKFYDWLFHYNIYNQTWNAIPREKYSEYWNNEKVDGVISSKKIETLIEIINKGNEFIKSIK
jgi:hypothetical protein